MKIEVKFISGAVYLGIGILVYLILGAWSVFTWSDPWLYVYMALWPFIIMWNLFIWLMAIILIGLVIYGIFRLFDK